MTEAINGEYFGADILTVEGLDKTYLTPAYDDSDIG
jgi:hypothetical protein